MTSSRLAPSFWRTVGLLVRASRHRAAGRRNRQSELLQYGNKKSSTNWAGLGFFFAIIFMLFLNGMTAFVVNMTVEASQRSQTERQGKIVVSKWFLDDVKFVEQWSAERGTDPRQYFGDRDTFSDEAKRLADRSGNNNKAEIERKLRDAAIAHGSQAFTTRGDSAPGLIALSKTPVAEVLGCTVLFWWMVMLVFQGEGLELDLQRRRHPMWEWLFSHPVNPGAVFLAEMVSPIAANPIYWGGPLFVGILYGFVYDPLTAMFAAVIVGVPVTVALACLGKALEIGFTLRLPPRTRAAVMGFMGWLGYASMMFLFLGVTAIPTIVTSLAKPLAAVATFPWPWLRWFLGGSSAGTFSFVHGIVACWFGSSVTTAASVYFSVWGAQQGLIGSFASDSAPARNPDRPIRFGKDPLYRKEFLWFIRDRSAIVQAILIPLTVAGFQIFNLRGVLHHAQGAWNYLCGAAIVFGTYFLWILGPKSLISEGTSLWIALTWPRGLEELLKAKAWLWSLISSGLVMLVLIYAAFLFPRDIPKIVLVAFGWYLFSRSMAEKTVTLVTVSSSSGESEKIPTGRRWAAQLGMLTFAIGILTRQWNLAVVGIVYSYITAAAMWQNFRARLPYLYDPWSEEDPPAPTLMHAMVSISILIELGAVVTGGLIAFTGRENAGIAQAAAYAVCSLIVSVGVWRFLSDRDVTLRDVLHWPAARIAQSSHHSGNRPWWRAVDNSFSSFALVVVTGAVLGLGLGLVAHGYINVLGHIPAAAEILRRNTEQIAKLPNLRLWLSIIAVSFAPLAEEYLFRGLLYRALDREWGGWRAVVGSAAFFAIYHPPLSWLPVALLGAVNAMLYKKTGRLEPAIVLHAVYNAVVTIR